MVLVYPTTVTLSNRINPDGTLQEDVRRRVDLSITLYQNEFGQTITMSGGYADREAPFTHAEAMKRYAIQQGVPNNDILKEEDSLDTIGQAYFVKKNVIVPKNWDRFSVVSSEYHIPRVKKIFNFIFGPEFLIEYKSATSLLQHDIKIRLKEFLSLTSFYMLFAGIKPGNDVRITERLFSTHQLYKKDKT